LEDKVFPLMREVVSKIQTFDDKIEDSRRQMVRFDEIVLDKASKYDIVSLSKRIDKTLLKQDFIDNLNKQTLFNEDIDSRTLINEECNKENKQIL